MSKKINRREEGRFLEQTLQTKLTVKNVSESG